MSKGRVFWITGLSGSGKTTISRLFYKRLKSEKREVVLLDGDELRVVLGIAANYSYEERRRLAFIYCRLCKMLADQGHDVVIATISMFYECHQWNRSNQSYYYEIYLRASMQVLKKRNQKNLFSGKNCSIVGVDISFEEPQNPDIILDNEGDASPEEIEEHLYRYITHETR